MKRRGKTIALSTVAVGLVVLVVAGILSKDRILEKWYLRELETGDLEEKSQVLEILGRVGSEESLLKLVGLGLREDPDLIRFLPQTPVPPGSLPIGRTMWPDGGKAAAEIRERIGKARVQSAVIRHMCDPKTNDRTRVYLAQVIILATSPRENLPELLRWPDAASSRANWGERIQEWGEMKRSAILALSQALSSADSLCREEAAKALIHCGPEAAAAVPALQAALQGPDEYLSQLATAALKRIQGTQDEAQR